MKRPLLFILATLLVNAALVIADVPGHDKELAKLKDKFKAGKILQQDELSLLQPGHEWKCTGYSVGKQNFTRTEPMPLYNFSIDKGLANTGMSAIRKFSLTPQGVTGSYGQHYVSYIRVTPSGDFVAEMTYKTAHPKNGIDPSIDPKSAAIADPASVATIYTICSNTFAKKGVARVAKAK